MKLSLGTGVFLDLELVHIIAARRVEKDYLLRLVEEGEASYIIYKSLSGVNQKMAVSQIDKFVEFYKRMRGSRLEKAVASARERGRKRGEAILAEAQAVNTK